MSALFKAESIDEVMRVEVESAVNELLKLEFTGFLDYEKYDPIGYNSGNSRNGTYSRQLKTRFGESTVEIPETETVSLSSTPCPYINDPPMTLSQ